MFSISHPSLVGWRPSLAASTSCVLVLVRSAWLLLHINSSDYEDSTAKNKPEFFGDAMACITPDVVSNVFKNGYSLAIMIHLCLLGMYNDVGFLHRLKRPCED